MEESDEDSAYSGGSYLVNKGYSYEEQFKQLYDLSDHPDRKTFLNDLFSFMQQRGTPVNRIPIMAKQVLDLFELYRLVVARGGLVEVINKKIWREITKGLNLPSSITSAAFTLRTQYMKYLYPYECEKEQLSSPDELQQAIDGNRREGRRSSNGNYCDLMGSPGDNGEDMPGPSGLNGVGSGVGVGVSGGNVSGPNFNGSGTGAGPPMVGGGAGPSTAASSSFLNFRNSPALHHNHHPEPSSPLSLVMKENNNNNTNTNNNNNINNNISNGYIDRHLGPPLNRDSINNECAMSSEEDEEENSSSIHSLSINPSMLSIATAQAEAINLNIKESATGLNGPLSSLHNHLNNLSSSNQNVEQNNNSLLLSLKINNVIYSGILYATVKR